MPWHWQRVFWFHRHQKGNKHLALIKLPIFLVADCSLPGLRHVFCSSCSFPNSHTATTPCQHNPLHGWTANWSSWKPTWKQNSVPKSDLPQSCTNSCAGTKGKKKTTKKKTVRGWEHAALGMGWSNWSHCHQGHAPVQGTDSTSIWESEMVLVTKLPCLQNSSPEDDAGSQGKIFSIVSFFEQSWHHHVVCVNWFWTSFCWTFSIEKNNAIATQSTEIS